MLLIKKFGLFVLVVLAAMLVAGCSGVPEAGDVIEVTMPEIKVNGTAVNPDGGSPVSVATTMPAPPAGGGVATIKIASHPVLEVPELRGPFGPDDYPELWQDGGAPVEVSGELYANADDQIWWKANESDDWDVLTEKVKDYTQIPTGDGWMLVHDLGGDGTHVSFLERNPSGSPPPASGTTPTPAPPSTGVASIQIEGYDLLEVPHMVGPFERGVYPEFWSGEGANIEVFGQVAAQADDEIWYMADGSSDKVQLTVNVAAYCIVPEGKGKLWVVNQGGRSYVKFLERIPTDW
jgi:hypothetical protein